MGDNLAADGMANLARALQEANRNTNTAHARHAKRASSTVMHGWLLDTSVVGGIVAEQAEAPLQSTSTRAVNRILHITVKVGNKALLV